jgi:ABC-type transporter Mla maintaining outer membrane lipid asymmetry permease subunit MlaE
MQTKTPISVNKALCGLIKSINFALLIASIGFSRDMQCARDAEAVSKATISAVVARITSTIIAYAVFALISTPFASETSED